MNLPISANNFTCRRSAASEIAHSLLAASLLQVKLLPGITTRT